MEARIPFADLADAANVPPRVGDVWLFHVFRIAHGEAIVYSAWEPTFSEFHQPFRFPRLKFAK